MALLLLLAAIAVLSAFVVWCARSESGSAWLLRHVPGLKVEAPRGALLGGDFAAKRVEWTRAEGRRLVVDELAWKGMRISRLQGMAPWLHLSFERMSARRAELREPPASSAASPRKPPASLKLPLALHIAELSVAELHLAPLGTRAVTHLSGRVSFGADQGATHRFEELRAQWEKMQFEGSAHIATAQPQDVQAVLRAWPLVPPELPWRATLEVQGPLARMQSRAVLRSDKPAQGEAPSLDAQAVVTPFAPWLLESLEARTHALDLSALVRGAPATALSGKAAVHSDGWNQPVRVDMQIENAAAGMWNERKLPVRRLSADVHGQLGDLQRFELREFSAELGTARRAAGHVSGVGRWARDGLSLDMRLVNVLTAALDARAAALRVSGPLSIKGQGALNDPAFGAELRGDLQGTPEAAERTRGTSMPSTPVRLRWTARSTRDRIQIDEALAEAGAAKATLQGLAQRQATSSAWQVKARTDWSDFDPRPWWRGREGSPWRAGPHRINAAADFDVTMPDATKPRVAALRGQANVQLRESVLAGVPASGNVSAKSAGGMLEAQVRLDSAGNRADAQLRRALEGDGRGDRLQLEVHAPALPQLSPLLRLLPEGPSSAGGSLEAAFAVNGRWPMATSEGHVTARNLALDDLRAATLKARWSVGTAPESPMEVQAEAAGLSQNAQRLERATLLVQGSGAAHRITLDGVSPARAPVWAEPLLGATLEPGSATSVALRASGGFTDALSQSRGWRGTLEQLAVATSRGQPLLTARGLDVEWQAGDEPGLSVSPGRMQVLGATLRIDRAHWRGGSQPAVDIKAELDPLAVAPLLARMQPDFGWSGDLTMSGRIDIRSAPSFSADVVFERAQGDLVVREPGSSAVQPLGLTDLRLALSAHEGTWYFTQALAGSTLGVFAGAQSMRLSPQAMWPSPDTPLEGVMEMRVDNLGTWGAWVPAGWRLTGTLHTSASFGGRFGAPELTGHMEGHRIGVRNLFEGVEVYDGEISVSLQGERAKIERFTAKAGEGTLSFEGDALLGEAPQARLSLKADRLRLFGRVDRRLITSGQAQLQLDATRLALDGSFTVDEGFFDASRADAPSLGGDVEVIRGDAPPAAESRATPRKARNVTLDLQVALGENLRLRGRGIDTGLRGSLHISAPGGRLALDGTVRTERGTYSAYGQELDIERGLIIFNGPIENPRLDILATRPNTDVRVGVAVSGTALSPRVRLFSEPEMPDTDKLSWLVLGRPTDGLGRTETALLQRAALALLAGGNASSSDPLAQTLGLDEISVRQTEGTTGTATANGTNPTSGATVRETVVTLGKQLSRRWYVGYERGLNATTGTWQLIYRLAQRFTLRAQSGLDNSLDVIWTWRWN